MPLIEKKCDDNKSLIDSTKINLNDLIYREKCRGDEFDKRIKANVVEIERLKARP